MLRAVVVFFLLLALPARAEVTTTSDSDPIEGTTYVGVHITSVNGRAAIDFLCGSDSAVPRVRFTHGAAFIESDSLWAWAIFRNFRLEYRVDQSKKRAYKFAVDTEDPRKGTLSGASDDSLDAAQGMNKEELEAFMRARLKEPVNDGGEEDLAKLASQFIFDFAGGNVVYVRVHVVPRKYTYKFDLTGLTAKLDALRDCYPPR